MAALVQPVQLPTYDIVTTLSADEHAHFNKCDMYKDGRESPSVITHQPFIDAVDFLIQRFGNRGGLNETARELHRIERVVLSQGLPAESITIIHTPGVDIFPSNFKNAIHDSGYTPHSISPNIELKLLPISTGDPGTRSNSTNGAKIVTWNNIIIDLANIGYEGITVEYEFDGNAKTVRIKIKIASMGTQPEIIIDSIRSYANFSQISRGPDYLRAGNAVKNAAILGTTNIIEIMKYLIGKALGDTLQAIELYIATTDEMGNIFTNGNTCGFTTDRVLTCRYKSVNQSVCLQVGKESGVKKIELYRGGDAAQLLQQIKGNYIANAVKNNRNVIFTIRQAMTGGSINIAGNNIQIVNAPPRRSIRDRLNDIVEYIENINSFILSLDTTDTRQSEEVIRKICAICTASHVFKAGTNKLINIKELFTNLSPAELNGLTIPNITVYSLKEIVGFQQYTGTFSQYLYALHLNPQLQGGGKEEKEEKRVKTAKKNFKEFVEDRIIPSNKRANEKMKFRKVVEMSIKKQNQKYIDSYYLLILIICSIIDLDDEIWSSVVSQFTLKYVTGIEDIVDGNNVLTHEEHIIQIFSSNIIEPIYYELYRTFLYIGYGRFNFEYIKEYVTTYIRGKIVTSISTIERMGSFSSLDSFETLDHDSIVYENVILATNTIANITSESPYGLTLITVLKKMIQNIRFYFPEIGFPPANFSEGDSIARTFSQGYGGSRRKPNKSIHNKRLKNTHKLNKKLNKKTRKGNKNHRKTYKKK
jgi:hypothetical protein